MIFFWSDTHFNHRGIIGYCGRSYSSVEDMNQDLAARWNVAVGPTDTIYLLGDFGFGPLATLQPIFEVLNGHKHLVVGNHDEKNPKVLKLPWESVSHLLTVKEESRRAVVCHYPLETWKNAHRGYLMFHGHSHGSLRRVIPHRFDVGVDVFGHPISFLELWERAQAQVFEVVDHLAGEVPS